jgi:hypothetical protein
MSSKDRLAALRQAREKGGRLQQWKARNFKLGLAGRTDMRSQKRETFTTKSRKSSTTLLLDQERKSSTSSKTTMEADMSTRARVTLMRVTRQRRARTMTISRARMKSYVKVCRATIGFGLPLI